MKEIKINEYIILIRTKKTARVIEIYTAPGESDKLFLISLPDGAESYAFNSQILPLNQPFWV